MRSEASRLKSQVGAACGLRAPVAADVRGRRDPYRRGMSTPKSAAPRLGARYATELADLVVPWRAA
ncbi:hypothetical protein ACWIE7_18835, partial [Dietzia sp. NPDC055343]